MTVQIYSKKDKTPWFLIAYSKLDKDVHKVSVNMLTIFSPNHKEFVTINDINTINYIYFFDKSKNFYIN